MENVVSGCEQIMNISQPVDSTQNLDSQIIFFLETGIEILGNLSALISFLPHISFECISNCFLRSIFKFNSISLIKM